MPPEALREPPSCTKKLDCFSEGVIMIQVCTRLWPEPGPRTQLVPDSRSPTGTMEMPVLEADRRKNHIDQIEPTHALLPILMDCLKYQERERPSSEELCQRLSGLKVSSHNKDDVEQHNDEIRAKDSHVVSQRQQLLENSKQLQDKDKQLQDKDRQLQDKEKQLQDKDMQIQDITRQLRDKDWELQQHQIEIASRERQHRQLIQQLEEQEQVTVEIQQANHSLQRQVEQLQQQLSQQIQRNPVNQPHSLNESKLTLIWRNRGVTPFLVRRGAAVVDENVAYFVHYNGKVCSYNSTTKKWSKLLTYPYQDSSLAVIDGQLTGIGGCDSENFTCTNKLFSLVVVGFVEVGQMSSHPWQQSDMALLQ